MGSPILPITNKLASHSSLEQPTPSAMPASAFTSTMLLRGGEDDPTSSLLFSSSFEDDRAISQKPILPRALSYSAPTTTTTTAAATATSSSSNCFYQQRRRRTVSVNSLCPLSRGDNRRQSFGRDVGHAAAETFLLTRLTLKLLRYLGLQMDYKISCPWLLLLTTFPRFSSSWILLFLLQSSSQKHSLW